MDARLIVVGGKATKSEVQLTRLPFSIGRSRTADLPIAHSQVSREHCTIYEVQGALVIRDLGSSNGTIVNGEPVTEVVLKPGDKLSVGPLTFVTIYTHKGEFPSLDHEVEDDEEPFELHGGELIESDVTDVDEEADVATQDEIDGADFLWPTDHEQPPTRKIVTPPPAAKSKPVTPPPGRNKPVTPAPAKRRPQTPPPSGRRPQTGSMQRNTEENLFENVDFDDVEAQPLGREFDDPIGSHGDEDSQASVVELDLDDLADDDEDEAIPPPPRRASMKTPAGPPPRRVPPPAQRPPRAADAEMTPWPIINDYDEPSDEPDFSAWSDSGVQRRDLGQVEASGFPLRLQLMDASRIQVGTPVKVAGIEVGYVHNLTWAEVRGELRAEAQLLVQEHLADVLREDVRVAVQPLEDGVQIIIQSPGSSRKRIQADQVVLPVDFPSKLNRN